MDIDSYNHHRFTGWLKELFKDTPCILCGKIHEVKIHQFVDRNISPDNSRKIKTVRIICHSNFLERKETGEKLQYTVTVLPGFLIPHSRVPLPDIYKATDEYLSGRRTIQQGKEKTFKRILDGIKTTWKNIFSQVEEYLGADIFRY